MALTQVMRDAGLCLAGCRSPLPIVFSPPFSTPEQYLHDLVTRGFAVLDAPATLALSGASVPDWDQLAPDEYLKDGGRYRQRRHASFTVQGGELQDVPYRPHWQPVDYNALHGGMERWFAPVAPATLAQPDWRALLRWLARVADVVHPVQPTGQPAKRTSSASTPKAASGGPRPRARTATASTWWPCSSWRATRSRAAKRACSSWTAHWVSASRWSSPGRCC
jgi:hypothetical protein